MGMAAILGMWPGPFELTFFLPSHGGAIWNLDSIGLVVSKEKKMLNLSDLGPRSISDLDLWYSYRSMYLFVNSIYQLWYHWLQWFLKNPSFYLFPIQKSKRYQIWHCCKICQGQPRVIIWTNLVVHEHPMQHTKLEGYRPFGSGEEYVLRFLPCMCMAVILVMWPGPFE